jgi:hypothetical protein
VSAGYERGCALLISTPTFTSPTRDQSVLSVQTLTAGLVYLVDNVPISSTSQPCCRSRISASGLPTSCLNCHKASFRHVNDMKLSALLLVAAVLAVLAHCRTLGTSSVNLFEARVSKLQVNDIQARGYFDPAKFAEDALWKVRATCTMCIETYTDFVPIPQKKYVAKGHHLKCVMDATDEGAGFLVEDTRSPPSAASKWSGDLKGSYIVI